MEYDKRAIIIISLCVIIGTILLVSGIILSEIEIRRGKQMEIYDNINN